MMNTLSINWEYLASLSLPFLIPLISGVFIILFSPFIRRQTVHVFLSSFALLFSIFATIKCWKNTPLQSWGTHMLLFDHLSYSFDFIFLAATFLTVLLAKDYLAQEKIDQPEHYGLLLFAVFGAMLMAHGGDLIVLFLGLEIMSLSAYILAGMKKGILKSYEASLKYFILGAFASGFLLYGIAMIYGATGSTSLAAFQQLTTPLREPILVLLAVALLLIGICFKVAAVPFHFWSPDVYEGSPTSVTAFMASVIKASGFALLIRLIVMLGHLPEIPWSKILTAISILTMTVGNLVAIRQTNIKRLLAYSSIAHAGYLLVGVTAALQKNSLSESTLGAVIFYLFAYSMMTIGAFAIVIAIGRRGEQAEEMTDLSGLSHQHPILAAVLSVFLFSLTGFPPLIGFMGKFYLFAGAMEAGLYTLVVIGVLNSVVSAYYYLAPIIRMYFHKDKGYVLPPISITLVIGIVICLFAVLYIGLFPSDVFILARESVRELVF